MKSALPIILVVAGIAFAYLAITTFQASTANVSFLGIDLSASDEGGQMTAALYGILALVCLGFGATAFRKANA
ncbi:MAG: hypothetical protein AAFN92_08655 [Bacteroidota bacterium]